MSLFRLVYGKACHFSDELKHKAFWAIQLLNFEEETWRKKIDGFE